MTTEATGWQRLCCAIVYGAAKKADASGDILACLAAADALIWWYENHE